jgi:hypothetical protein
MRFSVLLFSAFSAYAVAQSASGPNAFNVPPGGYQLTAGQPVTLTWSNIQGSTVTLQLRSGSPGALDAGTVIQGKFPQLLDKRTRS